MTLDLILFIVLALVAVGAALGMVFSRNAVYSAMFLILNFGTVAVFYLILEAPFIAMAQVTVYAGAIMVLFLFVVMLLGAEQLSLARTLGWQQPVAALLALTLLVEAGYIIFARTDFVSSIGDTTALNGGPEEIGLLLFNKYLLPFEITSVLLLAAMIGAIVLTKNQRKKEQD